jgi:hypothetical protein
MSVSALDFAKENIRRIKIKEDEDLRMHSNIKRKELEAREQKQKEQVVQDHETQMENLAREREITKTEYENYERHLKEITRKQMSRMGSDFSTKQQIETFRKKEQREIEDRKVHFNEKVFILFYLY